MKRQHILISGIVTIIVGGLSFFGGIQYQKSQQQSFRGMMREGQAFLSGQNANRTMFQGMRPVSGEIIANDETSITIKQEDGSSKIIVISDSVAINKATSGSKADLKQGDRITVFGTESNGSITAQTITLGGTMSGIMRKR